jgi:hypothetical protein
MKKEEFKPHNMYHPKTGEAVLAETYEQHLKLKKMKYGHSKPAKKKVAKKKAAKPSRTSFAENVEKRMGY